MNGRFWTSQFEFLVHHRAATQAGLSAATFNALKDKLGERLCPKAASPS